ncbi:MAG: response regulator [Pseudomonadota bacterium]|nr:response regulator [Pseudomonadota bacterium]
MVDDLAPPLSAGPGNIFRPAIGPLLRLVSSALGADATLLVVQRDCPRILAARTVALAMGSSLPAALAATLPAASAGGGAVAPAQPGVAGVHILDPPLVVGPDCFSSVLTSAFTWGGKPGFLLALRSTPRPWSAQHLADLADLADLAPAALEHDHEADFVTHASRLVTLSPDGILVHLDGVIVLANPAAARLTGAASEQALVGRPLRQLLAPPYLKSVGASITAPTAEAPAPMVLERLTRLDGGLIDVEVAELPYLFHDEPAVLLVIRDVTQRLAAEAATRRSEAQVRLLVEKLPAVAWATDAELGVVTMFGARRTAPGPLAEAPVGRHVAALLGDAIDAGLSAHRHALAGSPATFDVCWSGHTFGARVEPLVAPTGEVTGTLGIAVDLTERLQAEAQERELHVLSGLARLAGGVAHEMNNVLGAIMGYAASVEGEPLSVAVRQRIQRITDAARRGSGLTRRLLGFAREGLYERTRFPINDLVETIADRLRRETPPGIVIRVRTSQAAPWAEGDAAQLREALHALCTNGVESMPHGGTLTLTVSVGSPSGGSEGEVAIEVRDTGVGMDEQLAHDALEPFFTTKPLGAGDGLGLPMAYGIVARHGGRLTLESAPGHGTIARVSLPTVAPPPTLAPPSRSVPAPRVVTRRVLIVDDDEWVRESSSALLEASGYEVVTAANGPAGLEIFQAAPESFAFVLLDMRMPGMDGAEVLRRMVAIDPDARVVLCSGYTREQIGPGLFSLGRVGFLEKPFDLSQLREQIRAVEKDG